MQINRAETGSATFATMGHLLGYARVSTVDQELALQQDALTAAGCYRIFTDTASGSLDARPALSKVVDQLRPGDTLVVWRLDRLGRSIRHLIDFLADLDRRQVGFRSLTESIDTTSPGGRLVFHVFAALAEFERELIRERTNAGLAAARARGRRGGRPSRLTADQVKTARRLYDQKELTVGQIGDVLGVSRTTIYRALERHAAQASSTVTSQRSSRRKAASATS
jgi:DNA invertase Pin-like site-specific DNA recombinase